MYERGVQGCHSEFNDEESGIVKLKIPWKNVTIPRNDVPKKRAIPVSKLRAFFNVIPYRSILTNPLTEVGKDVVLISFCLCGLNAVDIFNTEKDQYVNGIFHYEPQKTRKTRANKGYFEILLSAKSLYHIFDVKIATNCIKYNNQSLFFTFFLQIE